jgi:1-acyl-sn-glycerol-3-phosphate acyltransferase
MTNNYKETEEWGSALWKHLYVYYDPAVDRPTEYDENNEDFNRRKREEKDEVLEKYNNEKDESENKKETILKVHNAFNHEWGKLKKRVIN